MNRNTPLQTWDTAPCVRVTVTEPKAMHLPLEHLANSSRSQLRAMHLQGGHCFQGEHSTFTSPTA